MRGDFLDLSAPLPGGDLLEFSPRAGDDDAPVSRSTPAARSGVQGRQTVTISGRGSEGYATRNGTRPSRAQRHTQVRRHERAGFRPDRVAMWAVLLGVTMILFAAASSHAAVLAHRSAGSARIRTAHVAAASRGAASRRLAPPRAALRRAALRR